MYNTAYFWQLIIEYKENVNILIKQKNLKLTKETKNIK